MKTLSLEQENQQLRRTIRLLASKAEANQATLQGFFDLELKLLSCNRLSQLLHLMLNGFPEHFKLSRMDIILFDPEFAARHLLDNTKVTSKHGSLRFVENYQILKQLFPRGQIQIGQLKSSIMDEAFPNCSATHSNVLLPLVRQNCLIGALHFGSADPERYSEHYRYDYISHLASVVSVCIENCISQENLRRLSTLDTLTQVYNRGSFDQEIIREVARASREQSALSCLFLDLDHFKKVNDTFGHRTGDTVLKQIGQLLSNTLRKSDLVARYGGEEFSILLSNCDGHQALNISEQLRQKISQQVFRSDKGHPFRMSTSIGVTTCHPAELRNFSHQEIAEELVSSADNGVYQAKHQGRNQVCPAAFQVNAIRGQQTA